MAVRFKGDQRRRKKSKPSAQDLKRKVMMREIELSALNTERYRRLWREMFMRAKMPDIERNIQVAWQTFERSIDLKDYSIGFLLDTLEEATDQRRRNAASHARAVDRALQVHEARLKDADELFNCNVELSSLERIDQLVKIDNQRNDSEAFLKKIGFLANRRFEEYENNARSTAISKIDAFIEDGKNERRIAGAQLEKGLVNVWDKLRSILSDYRTNTEDRRKSYEVLEKKDRIDRRAIERQSQRTATLLEEIARFREKISNYETDISEQISQVTQESNFFHNAYRKANNHFLSEERKDKNQAAVMSVEYNRTAIRLRALVNKAERVLMLAQICRKYETEDEKILPPVVRQTVSQTLSATDTDLDFPTLTYDPFRENNESAASFWRRVGAVKLIRSELRLEKNELLSRINYLRDAIKMRILLSNGSYSLA